VKREKALGEPVYGDPNGDPMGDSSEAGDGDRYLALVQRTLRDTYILPATLSDRDRMRLKATVVLYIDPDGQVLRYAFEERSGNGAFDDALERAIRAARLPPPPSDLRDRYRSEGLGVVYRP
jgi:colicin import membrane protein/protein TonB